jgi:oligopeptide transport system substrate-binding protein
MAQLSFPSPILDRIAFAARSNLAPLITLLGLTLACSGCGRRETPVEAGIRTQTLLLGNFAEPADLDPQAIYAFTDTNIAYALFEGLTSLDEKTSQAVPAVAERWDISPDGLVYTFHLRPTARWSNGDPVTAQDFVFSFHRILSPAFAAFYSYMLWPIRNAEAFNAGKLTDFTQVGVEALDPATLRVTLAHPTPYLPALAAHNTWLPVRRATIEKFGKFDEKGTRWTRAGSLVGNGAFTLTEWTPNSRIVVAKNPRYWNAAHVRLNRVLFFPIESTDTEELAFRSGQLHVTNVSKGVPSAKIPYYRAHAPGELRIEPALATGYLVFNVTRAPLDQVKVRRALAMAIDRATLSRDISYGSRPPAYSLTAPDCAGYTAQAEIHHDFAAARQLLAEAGFPGGRGLPSFEIQSPSDGGNLKTVEAIQAMWRKELGVQTTIASLEQKVLFQNQQSLNYTIGVSAWIADYPDPSTFLNQYVTGGGNNWTGWGNHEYDRLIAETQATADNTRRYALFQAAEKILLDEAPLAPLFNLPEVYLIHASVRGWEPSLIGFHRFTNIWLER